VIGGLVIYGLVIGKLRGRPCGYWYIAIQITARAAPQFTSTQVTNNQYTSKQFTSKPITNNKSTNYAIKKKLFTLVGIEFAVFIY
jgi:hypothetical protein